MGWREEREVEGKSIKEQGRVRLRKEKEIEEKSSEKNIFTLKEQCILLMRLKEVITTVERRMLNEQMRMKDEGRSK